MNQRRILSSTGLILAAILAVGVIILANTLLTSERLDLTQNKLFTLSQGTVNIIKSLKEPVSLDFYFSRKTLVNFPQLMTYASRVRDLLGEYAALSNGKIKLTVIEPEPFSEAEGPIPPMTRRPFPSSRSAASPRWNTTSPSWSTTWRTRTSAWSA
jgi:ABC-type uncharacterized transport system involved in gliding motility auxiliary subunit